MTDSSERSVVYVDANPIAYAFEGPEELASALMQLFSVFRRAPGLAVTSELTLAEVLPKNKDARPAVSRPFDMEPDIRSAARDKGNPH
jgi:hypothetical protein